MFRFLARFLKGVAKIALLLILLFHTLYRYVHSASLQVPATVSREQRGRSFHVTLRSRVKPRYRSWWWALPLFVNRRFCKH